MSFLEAIPDQTTILDEASIDGYDAPIPSLIPNDSDNGLIRNHTEMETNQIETKTGEEWKNNPDEWLKRKKSLKKRRKGRKRTKRRR